MDSKTTSNWIDSIIQDLTDPAKTLEDCLHKTLVLSYTLKNDKLKTWVEGELNSYKNEDSVPEYRKVGVEVWGNVAQATFGGLLRGTKNLHFQGSKDPFFIKLRSGFTLTSDVASLKTIVRSEHKSHESYLKFSLSPYLFNSLEKLYPGWTIENAWMQISAFTITGVLSKIKTNLLQFLLTLNEELGNETNFSIMASSEKVNHILEHTIGHFHAENVTFGSNYQTKGNQNTVTQGNNNSQQVSMSSDSLVADIKQIAIQVDNLLREVNDIRAETKEDISQQLQVVNSQVNRTEPNLGIVSKSLQIIEGLLVEAAASVYTPIILGTLEHLIPRLTQ